MGTKLLPGGNAAAHHNVGRYPVRERDIAGGVRTASKHSIHDRPGLVRCPAPGTAWEIQRRECREHQERLISAAEAGSERALRVLSEHCRRCDYSIEWGDPLPAPDRPTLQGGRRAANCDLVNDDEVRERMEALIRQGMTASQIARSLRREFGAVRSPSDSKVRNYRRDSAG